MKGRFKINKPDHLEATLSLTLSLFEWQILRADLKTGRSPGWELKQLIGKLIDKMDVTLEEEVPHNDE